MAFNGSGTFSRLFNWVTDKGNAVPVTASRMDSEMDGMATGLSTAICKDGQTVTTARVPFVLGTSAMQGAVGGVSYSFTNDADTGLYSPASGSWALSCDGTQVLNSVAVGVSVPTGIGFTVVSGAGLFGGTLSVTGEFTASATASARYFSGMGAMPVGAMMDYAGSSAPAGWLLCFGQSLVRASFPALFTAIGTTYGAADGTHFTLPDCRGRLTAGKDDMGGSAASRITVAGKNFDGTVLGGVGGAQNHTLIQTELPTTIGTSNETGVPSGISGPNNIPTGASNVATPFWAASVVTGVLNIINSGGGVAHSVLPPAIVLNKIIFAGV